MKTNTTFHAGSLSRARFTSLHAIATAGLLLAGLGTAASRADILYGSMLGTNSIEKFTPGGVGSVFTSSGLNGPTALAFDSAGNLYVANVVNNTIVKFSPTGTDLGVFASTGLNFTYSLAFDRAGNLYAANNGNSTIEKFSPTGTDLGVFASTGLNGPTGLAFDSAGNLYAANLGGPIEKFTPGGLGSVFASNGLNGPVGLAFDRAGNLYAANTGTGAGSNTIEKFTPDGTGASLFASTGLLGPRGLAFDSAGNLYAANNNSTIEKFTSDGSASLFADNTNGVNSPWFLAFTNDAGVPLSLPPLPEPATCALLLFGGLGVLATRGQRVRRKS